MDKVLKLNFGNSKEDIKLYNWLITHKNMEEYVKKILYNRMDETILDMEEIEDDLFDPDYFRVEQKKETMISIDEIINHFK